MAPTPAAIPSTNRIRAAILVSERSLRRLTWPMMAFSHFGLRLTDGEVAELHDVPNLVQSLAHAPHGLVVHALVRRRWRARQAAEADGRVRHRRFAARRKRREVHLRAAGRRNKLSHIVGANSPAGQYFDASRRPLDQFPQPGASVVCRLGLSGGKYPGETEVDYFVERPHRLRHRVKRAMEYRLPAIGDFYQLSAARSVDAAVRLQYAEHDAVSAVFDQQCGVAPHGDKFFLGIAEAAGARTQHRHQRNAYALLRLDQSA